MTPREFATRAAHLDEASEVVRSLRRFVDTGERLGAYPDETVALLGAAFELGREIEALKRACEAAVSGREMRGG